jgi:hypothetical protein
LKNFVVTVVEKDTAFGFGGRLSLSGIVVGEIEIGT